ncbi:phosphomannomutase/phosphoglucomutase [Candidatus Dojkabacteria bacterium]|nr:phosphomannomutase/phosphoglucomutase [Candidatus Dojkabacteria bacterium]
MDKSLLDKIFLAYDIRGIIGEELTENFYLNLGKALVKFWNAKVIAVGIDMRQSSRPFSKALIEGITDMGCDVYFLGEIITEIGYFSAASMKEIDGTVIVTASHNPEEYNGAKIVGANASVVAGNTGFEKIKKIIIENNFPSRPPKGKIINKDLIQDYRKKVLSFINIEKIRDLKVVVDAGNGLGGKFFDIVFAGLPLDVTRMHFKPDGSFPNHPPNPAEEKNIREIREKTKSLNADFGIAFDGDADRASFIDSKGRAPSGYYTGPLIASHLIRKEKVEKPKIIHDTRLIWAPHEEISNAGGIPVMSKSGRSFMREAMQKYNALFGFETTSHMYYRDYFFWDSGMVTIALMLELLSESEKKLSELCDDYYEKYPTGGEINFEIKDTKAIFEMLKDKFKEGKYNEIDGISFDFTDWRFNLRESNTQPFVRLSIEAKDENLVSEKVQLFSSLLGEEYSKTGK